LLTVLPAIPDTTTGFSVKAPIQENVTVSTHDLGLNHGLGMTIFIISERGDAIPAEFKKGTGFTEISKAVRLPQYAHWEGYKEWLEMKTSRLMTDLWMGLFPWVPDARQATHANRFG
jgi:hypothetical protein